MNQQQKSYTIQRIGNIAEKYLRNLESSDSSTLEDYRKHTVICVQDLLANDRELLKTLPIKEGLSIDANTNISLNSLFDLREITEKKQASNPHPKSDFKNRYDARIDLSVLKSNYSFYFNYADTYKRAKDCIAEYQNSVDQIMIGSDADALKALETFAAVFGE